MTNAPKPSPTDPLKRQLEDWNDNWSYMEYPDEWGTSYMWFAARMRHEEEWTAQSAGLEVSRFAVSNSESNSIEFWVVHRADLKPKDLDLIVLNVLDEKGWQEFANTYANKFPKLFLEGTKSQPDDKAFEAEKKMFENFKWGMAYVCPRGVGPSAWDGSADTLVRNQDEKGSEAAKKIEADRSVRAPLVDAKAAAAAEKARIHNLRRFYLLGQTLEGQQVWDIRCAIRALRSIEGLKDTKLWLQASRNQAGNALYASLFEDGIARLDLHELPHSHMEGPVYLNVLKYLDIPQAAAMATERTRVVIYDDDQTAWEYPKAVGEKLGWGADKKTGLQLRSVPKEEKP